MTVRIVVNVTRLAGSDGLLDAWDRGDALGRRELLAALFVELDVRDGKIWRIQPQPDVAAELWTHLEAGGFILPAESVGVAQAGRYSNHLHLVGEISNGRITNTIARDDSPPGRADGHFAGPR